MHVPVLLNEVLEALNLSPGKFVIDGTFGGGGHAKAIMEQISPGGKLLGVDWDRETIERAKRDTEKGKLKKLILYHGNYADLPKILRGEKLGKADAVLLDLGFSTEQLEGRGFSFREDEPLLMTYNDEETPLYALLRQLRKTELAKVIRELSDERYAERIAEAIYERGREGFIKTTGELADTIRNAVPQNYEHGRIDPATRTFMALRIFANDELGNLSKFLKGIKETVAPGGIAAVISFHSKEDGMVKKYFRELSDAGKAELVNKKPILPSESEIKQNPKSRSAKLRAIKIK